jgi:ribosomal protein S18 acetylase RimI-like enzyme
VIHRAEVDDAGEVARLLDDFNREYDEYTPGVETLTERARQLISEEEMTVLLADDPPVGLAVLRFRPSIWFEAPEAYLAELYVAPDRRGEGLGRELLDAALELARERGAACIDLGTSEDDTAALSLYESAGFTNREGRPDGPKMLYYERELEPPAQ